MGSLETTSNKQNVSIILSISIKTIQSNLAGKQPDKQPKRQPKIKIRSAEHLQYRAQQQNNQQDNCRVK